MIRIGDTVVSLDALQGMTFHIYDSKDNCGIERVNSYTLYLGGTGPFAGKIEKTGSYDEIKPEVDAFLKVLWVD